MKTANDLHNQSRSLLFRAGMLRDDGCGYALPPTEAQQVRADRFERAGHRLRAKFAAIPADAVSQIADIKEKLAETTRFLETEKEVSKESVANGNRAWTEVKELKAKLAVALEALTGVVRQELHDTPSGDWVHRSVIDDAEEAIAKINDDTEKGEVK